MPSGAPPSTSAANEELSDLPHIERNPMDPT